MIDRLYNKHFQKSFTFLYPLIGFTKSKDLQPIQVYIGWKDRIKFEDRKLVCLYQRNPNDQVWKEYEINSLLNHSMLDFCEEISENMVVYVFDMEAVSADFDTFLRAQYSKLSGFAKSKISGYFGVSSAEFAHIESFLWPEKYHHVYAELLHIDVKHIIEGHELCNAYNPTTEMLVSKNETVES